MSCAVCGGWVYTRSPHMGSTIFHSSLLRAEILSKGHTGRLARRLRARGHLNAQITHTGLGVGCQAVEDLLPAADEMQISRVRQAFFGKHPGIRRERLVTGRDGFGKREGPGTMTVARVVPAAMPQRMPNRSFATVVFLLQACYDSAPRWCPTPRLTSPGVVAHPHENLLQRKRTARLVQG